MAIDTRTNNKRLAKNSLLLYVRLIFVMLGNLLISRIILDNLGASDYGLYNVVGGFVTFFTVLTSSFAAATSRFLTFELGKNNIENLKNVFNISIQIHIILGVIIAILLETLGIWYLNNKMNIEPDRLVAANYVLQFSIITLLFTLFNVPYNAALMAHEQMDVYAYLSILDVALKLFACIMIPLIPYDGLIVYGFLLMVFSIIVRIAYVFYCRYHYEECKICKRHDRNQLKTMLIFTGWNFIGASSGIIKYHGTNLVLNYFFGTIVNAAYGLSSQVSSALNAFSSGIVSALNPQIIKQYSEKNMDYMFRLIFVGSRASFYMMMLVAVPLFLNTDFVIDLWLKDIPENTVSFVKILIIITLINMWSQPLITAMLASGDIKKYQILVGGTELLCVPLSYILISFGLPPIAVFWVMLLICVVTLIIRVVMLKGMIGLPARNFMINIVGRSSVVCIISCILAYMINYVLNVFFADGSELFNFLISSILSVVISLLMIILLDTTNSERSIMVSFINKKLNRKV